MLADLIFRSHFKPLKTVRVRPQTSKVCYQRNSDFYLIVQKFFADKKNVKRWDDSKGLKIEIGLNIGLLTVNESYL